MFIFLPTGKGGADPEIGWVIVITLAIAFVVIAIVFLVSNYLSYGTFF